MRLHMGEELLIDGLSRSPKGELPQRGEIAGREIVLKSVFGGLGDVNLSFFQPLNEIVRRDIDNLDVVGAIDYRVGNCLSNPDLGDLGHDIIEAFDVLDVDGGVDIDAGSQQFLDVATTLGVAAPGCIGMSEFIDEHQLGSALEDGIEIHLLQIMALISNPPSRYDLQALEQGLGLLASMGLNHPDHDVDLLMLLGPGGLQHLISLADSGCRAEKDLQPPLRFPLSTLEQGIGRRPLILILAVVTHFQSNDPCFSSTSRQLIHGEIQK